MTENTTPVEEQPSSSVQAGDLTTKLQACRESAGLDIEQAADEMHLSPSLLRALEKEDFVHLPEPPYVRGYLRGYAKLADQDAKDLIRTYEALRGADPDEIAHHFAPARPLGKVTQPSISPSTFKFIALAVLVLGLGLLSMLPGVRSWFSDTWSNFSAQTAPPQVARPAPAIDTFTARKDAEEQAAQEQTQATKESADAESSNDTATATAAAANATESETSQQTTATDTATDNTESDATAKPEATDTTAVSTDTSATEQATTTDSTQSTDSSAAATTETTTADSSTTDNNTATDNANAATDTTTATPQPIAGEVNVKLEFSEEVWMQVKDEGKKTLFEALNSAGSTKEFKATTPLNFKVGNASGVKIYLNGQEYDQTPYIKGSVARFKVE